MVVVDSSALLPLARVGRLDLVFHTFEAVHAPAAVEDEVVEGKPGSTALATFLEEATLHEPPESATEMGQLEGIAQTDAAVVLLGEHRDDVLLANDRGQIDVARAHGLDPWWVTTLLLSAVKHGRLTADEGHEMLYDLVDAGMNLSPQVYARLERQLAELED